MPFRTGRTKWGCGTNTNEAIPISGSYATHMVVELFSDILVFVGQFLKWNIYNNVVQVQLYGNMNKVPPASWLITTEAIKLQRLCAWEKGINYP